MNPNFKTDLAKSYRSNDIRAASDRRRYHASVEALPNRVTTTAGVAERTRLSLAVVRRLIPRSA